MLATLMLVLSVVVLAGDSESLSGLLQNKPSFEVYFHAPSLVVSKVSTVASAATVESVLLLSLQARLQTRL